MPFVCVCALTASSRKKALFPELTQVPLFQTLCMIGCHGEHALIWLLNSGSVDRVWLHTINLDIFLIAAVERRPSRYLNVLELHPTFCVDTQSRNKARPTATRARVVGYDASNILLSLGFTDWCVRTRPWCSSLGTIALREDCRRSHWLGRGGWGGGECGWPVCRDEVEECFGVGG